MYRAQARVAYDAAAVTVKRLSDLCALRNGHLNRGDPGAAAAVSTLMGDVLDGLSPDETRAALLVAVCQS